MTTADALLLLGTVGLALGALSCYVSAAILGYLAWHDSDTALWGHAGGLCLYGAILSGVGWWLAGLIGT